MFKKLLSSKKQFHISLIALVLTVIAVIAMVVVKTSSNQKVITADMIHSKEYETVESEDEGFDNCEFVKFTAFFTKDLDGNGTAEKTQAAEDDHRYRTGSDNIISHTHVVSVCQKDCVHMENFHERADKKGLRSRRPFPFKQIFVQEREHAA